MTLCTSLHNRYVDQEQEEGSIVKWQQFLFLSTPEVQIWWCVGESIVKLSS